MSSAPLFSCPAARSAQAASSTVFAPPTCSISAAKSSVPSASNSPSVMRSDGYIALPGGVGTLEELLEVLTLNQLGYLRAPVVIFNQNGYYDALIAQLRTCVEQEFADASCLALYAVADTPEGAVQALRAFQLPELPNKIKDAIQYDKEAST